MAGVKITLGNIKRIQNLLRNLPDSMKESANQIIVEEFQTAVKESKSIAQAARYTGALENGIELRSIEGKYQYISSAPHAVFAEFGTKGSYRPVPGFERWASQYRNLKINAGGSAKDRIYEWAAFKGIEKNRWWRIYQRIVIRKDAGSGMRPIVHPTGGGYFLPPYFRAKGRIEKRLKEMFAKGYKKTRK